LTSTSAAETESSTSIDVEGLRRVPIRNVSALKHCLEREPLLFGSGHRVLAPTLTATAVYARFRMMGCSRKLGDQGPTRLLWPLAGLQVKDKSTTACRVFVAGFCCSITVLDSKT